MPAVIVLNFVGSTYSAADPPAKLAVAARQHGFITVVPESVEASWNAGTCCGAAVARSVDDPQFLRLLVEDLPDAVPVDPNRVYLVGYSNGGMLAASMICRGAPGVAGVALVEATLLQARCDGAQPVDLLQIHQTEDEVVPFAGTTTSKLATDGVLPSVTDAFGRLSTALGCEPNSSAPLRTEGVTTESRACADGTRAMLVVIEGGSHAWPDGVAVPVDATSLIVEVFDLETVGRPIS